MKLAWVLVATTMALALQTTVARVSIGSRFSVDLVLVAVVYAALSAGPSTGLLVGTVAGLIQDALSTGAGVGVIGIGGFSKSLAGFLAGVVGTQFIVTEPFARFVVFALGSVVQRAAFIGVYALLGLRDFGSPYGEILQQALANAVIGVLAFQVSEFMPGAVDRRRNARTKPRL